jgi:hypothetical protein
MMPTAAKLFAAVFLGLTGALVVYLVELSQPPTGDLPVALAVTVSVAVIVGWRACGPYAGNGYGSAMLAGLKATIYLVVLALLVLAVMQMFRLAWRHHYHAPSEAVVDIIGLALGFAKPLLTPQIAGVLGVGGLVTGIMAEWAGRRWR